MSDNHTSITVGRGPIQASTSPSLSFDIGTAPPPRLLDSAVLWDRPYLLTTSFPLRLALKIRSPRGPVLEEGREEFRPDIAIGPGDGDDVRRPLGSGRVDEDGPSDSVDSDASSTTLTGMS